MQAAQTQAFQYTAWEDLSEKEQLESIYCELHKDVYGVKARWYTAATVEQARKDVEALQAEGERVWAQERAEREQAGVRFEQRVQDTIKLGAGDRATALRWIMDAEGEQDKEFLEYRLGLAYGTFK